MFLTKLMRATLVLGKSRFCLTEDVCYFSQSTWAYLCSGAPFAESKTLFHNLVGHNGGEGFLIVSSESGWGNSDDYMEE